MNKPSAVPTLLSEVAGKTIADALARQGFASTGIVTHWAEIVGAEIAAHAEPMRMSWPRRVHEDAPEPATLVLRVEGPVALEIQHLSGVIIEKVNRSSAGARSGASRSARRRCGGAGRRSARRPGPGRVARLAAGMADIKDEDLRGALARLGAAVKRT